MSDKNKIIMAKYMEFKKIPFPNNSMDNIEMQDVFSELVLFDSQIAGTIEKLIKNKAIFQKDLAYDKDLEERILNIKEADPGLKDSYLSYLGKIKELISYVGRL